MTKTIIAVALLSLSSVAAANCGNNKPVGNGCNVTPDTVTAPNVTVSTGSVNNSTAFNPTNTFNPTNQVGVGVDVGVRNNNANTNNVSNINANYNNARSDSSSLSNSASNSTSNATVGNLTTGASTSNATVGNVAGGSASASVGNVSGGSSSVSSQNSAQGGAGGQAYNSLNYTVQEAQRPVSSAVAPTIIHSGGQDTCMGSSSASVQGMSLGVAVGSTWTDKHCEALRASVRLNELGLKRTAMARLCAIPEIAEAFAISGEFSCNKQ